MHNIMYETYPEKTSEKAITEDVLHYVQNHGDMYGTDRVQFPTSMVFDNYEAAQNYIDSIDHDFYGGYAVKYYDFSKMKFTKKIEELQVKIKDVQTKWQEYEQAHSVKNQKAVFIGCPECGSKLNRERLKAERCPLCHAELRAKTTLERLASFESRIREYEKRIGEERMKEKKKAEVKWLVKFEYHS